MTLYSSGTGRMLVRWLTSAANLSAPALQRAIARRDRAFEAARVTRLSMAALTGLLWLVLGVHSALAQSQDQWTEVTTQHFRVQAVNDHAAQASWYAGFVEQVHY